MNAPFAQAKFSETPTARLEQRVRVAGDALRRRYGGELTAAEVDLVFAHYLLGLVATARPEAAPEWQLSMVRSLAALLLTPEEVDRAVHGVPPADESFVARALRTAEQVGRRDGESFLAAFNSEVSRPGTANHSQSSSPFAAS